MVVTVAAFLITVAYNDNDSLDDLLQALGISVVYSTQLVIKGRYKTAQDFDISTVKDFQSMVENVNKLFGRRGIRTIYFSLLKISQLRVINVYFGWCMAINQILNIPLISMSKCNFFYSAIYSG